MTRGLGERRTLGVAGLVAALLLAAGGALLLGERPGLRLEFFALDVAWRGEPLYREIRMPRLDEAADLRGNALPVLFSARWRGWLWVERGGRHRFELRADDSGYLRLDGAELLDTAGRRPGRGGRARVRLARGFHPIEIGLAQGDGRAALAVEWTPPGGAARELPAEVLYARRPLHALRLLRGGTEALSPLGVRLAGAVLLLFALLVLGAVGRRAGPELAESWRRAGRRARARIPARWRARLGSRRALYAAFFLALFAATWAAAMPWTAATFAGDDAAYISASQFPNPSLWYFNRMVHVYLLQAFIAIFGGGDGFLGSRIYGGFVFAVTVTALAVAVRQLGPRLQLRTLAVMLFLLFSQVAVIGGIGIAFTDHSLMMFLTVALAVFLHGRSVEATRPRHEWPALVLGVLALAACKSKITGVIVFWLPALLVFAEGRIDGRRFARRMAYFLGGFGLALGALMTADLAWHGDFWWSLRPRHFAEMSMFLDARVEAPQGPGAGWLHVLWPAGARVADLGLLFLWILALAAPLVAGARRVPIERRILYLWPALFLLMLVVVYSRAQNVLYSSRMLTPILPAACFVGGALFFHLGIERPRWAELVRPRTLVPLYAAAAAICLIVTPYLAGELAAEELVPAGFAARFGWQPEQFLRATQIPALLLAGLLLAALGFHRRRVRLAVALVATFALLGASFERSAVALSHRSSAQVAELILYPWRAFEREIAAALPGTVQFSPDVKWRLGMLGATHMTVGMIFFGRPDLVVTVDRAMPRDADLAIASRAAYNVWCGRMPELAATARTDPSGLLVLVRPREAARIRAAGR